MVFISFDAGMVQKVTTTVLVWAFSHRPPQENQHGSLLCIVVLVPTYLSHTYCINL